MSKDNVLGASMNIAGTTNLKVGSTVASTGYSLNDAIVEELRIYNRILTPEEIAFMYNNRYASQSSLAKPVYSTLLTSDNYWESDSKLYSIVHGLAPANFIKKEAGYVNSSGEVTQPSTPLYSVNLGYQNILPASCKLTYQHANGKMVGYTDDPSQGTITVGGNVVIEIEYINGTINVREKPQDIISDSIFYIEFGVQDTIQYTEAGIFDNDDNCVAYATFPVVEFTGIQNQMSLTWIIDHPDSFNPAILDGDIQLDGTLIMDY